MPSIQFKVNDQWINCQVLAKIHEQYQIRFWDDSKDLYQTLFVKHEDLKFPSFGDLMFC